MSLKKIGMAVLSASLASFVIWTGVSTASAAMEAKSATEAKSKYLVISPHTGAECLKALDEVNAQGSKTLAKYEWGCMSGDHTGYLTTEAGSEAEALNMVPADLRANAKVVKLSKFTPEQIKSLHEKH